MLRLLVLSLIFAVSLFGLSDSETIKRASSYMKAGGKTNHFRAYNDYKSLYLRSILSENEKLKTIALEGIVKSGRKLHIDVLEYSNELAYLKASQKKKKPSKPSKPKETVKKAPKPQKSTLKISQPKEKKDIRVTKSNKLKSVGFKGDELVLEFDKKLNSKQVNYFTLFDSKKKKYKYIFDIHASMLTKSKTLRKSGVQRIKIAQYKPNTLRLVLENSSKLKVKFFLQNKKLIANVKTTTKLKKATKKPTTTTPSRLDRNKVIVIDPGHGGKDPGAVGYRKYREKIVVMDVSKELKKILKSRGYKVYMTRTKDKRVKLSTRTKYANKKKADIFISIHANAVDKKTAAKVHGIETYFLSKSRTKRAKRVAAKENSADLSDMNFYGKQSFLNTLSSHNIVASNKLAIDLQRGMLGSLKKKYNGVHDGGVREGPFWVLVGAQMPSVLVEVGFITHPKEARRLVSSKYQKRLALGLADGIERYFMNNIK